VPFVETKRPDDRDIEYYYDEITMFFDKHHKIESFEEIGMIDPFQKKSIEKANARIQKLGFDKKIYPPAIMDVIYNAMFGVQYASPPKVVFVPDKKTLRAMVKAVLKYGKEPLQVFMLRFGIVDR